MDRLLDLLIASERPDHRKLTCNCLCSFGLTPSNRTLEPLKVFQKRFLESQKHFLKVSHNEQSTWKSNACKTHHMIWLYQWRSHKGKVLSSQRKSPEEGLPKNQGMFWSATSRLSQAVKICLSKINFRLWTLGLSRHVGTIFGSDLLCDKRLAVQISKEKKGWQVEPPCFLLISAQPWQNAPCYQASVSAHLTTSDHIKTPCYMNC